QLAEHILTHLHNEYPVWNAQVLGGAAELSLPRARHPVFFGSFDWHSSVHSHWSLVATLDQLEAPGLAGRVRAALDESFKPEQVAGEVAYWRNFAPMNYERPYGAAWLLRLDAELAAKSEPPYDAWRRALEPLVGVFKVRIATWLRWLQVPNRTGIHSQTAWGLWQTIVWADGARESVIADLAREKALACYADDRDAPVRYEKDQDSFFSPILNEAALMSLALGPQAYLAWLRGFLPSLFDANAPHLPEVHDSADSADPMEGHTVGLPLTRALAYRQIAAGCPEAAQQAARLASGEAARGLKRLRLEDYATGHWTASFAIAWLLGRVTPL
ncbi:MAG: DUF2891 domain-containing protein, partial [Propionibacteriaceae bacterium]|nr:DUF2891 domain-containing protein [Propionibacteriaceae bacterium]